MTNKIETLFDRLLSETESDTATPAERASLHSVVARAHSAKAEAGDATERLAAHLDGALDSRDAARFDEMLAGSSDEVYELEAAQSFLDRIDAARESAPADLVAAAAADIARETKRHSARRSWFLNSASWGRQFAWAGGAAATVVLGVVIIDRAGEIVGDPRVAVISARNVEAYAPGPAASAPTALPAVPASPVTVSPMPPVTEARPSQQASPRTDERPRDRRNERETSLLADTSRAGNAGQPQASADSSASPAREQDLRAPMPMAVAPPPPAPPPAPAARRTKYRKRL